MADVNDYPYSSGLIVGADGKVYDLAKLLANEDADTGLRADPNRYPYRGGLIVGSDGNVYDLVTLIQESGGGGGGGGSKIVAENYSAEKSYAVGEHAVNGGKLYVKTSGAEVAEAWNPAHWTEVTVGEEISQLSSSIEKNSQTLHNLVEIAKGNIYDTDTDDDEAIAKIVPVGAARYAELEKWGGKTVVQNGELLSADVSAVKTVGKNFIKPSYIDVRSNANNVYVCRSKSAGTGRQELFLEAGSYTLSVFRNLTPIIMAGLYVDVVDSDGTITQITSAYTASSIAFTLDSGNHVAFNIFSADGDLDTNPIDIQLEVGSIATAYVPYKAPVTLLIPAAVRALGGYGVGMSDGSLYNSIELVGGNYWFYHRRCEIVGDTVTALDEETVIDITNLMNGYDGTLDTEQGGTIEFVQSNSPALPIPSTVNYMIKLEEAI